MADREIAFSGVILESLSIGCGKLAVRLTGSTVIDPTDELGVSGPRGTSELLETARSPTPTITRGVKRAEGIDEPAGRLAKAS